MPSLDSSTDEAMPAFKDVLEELHYAVSDLLKENDSLRAELDAMRNGHQGELGTLNGRAEKTLAMIKERRGAKLLIPNLNGVSARGRW